MIYCAPYILPIDTAPLLDGAIVVEQDKIAAIGSRRQICANYPIHPITELPAHILMPGLVNCHTHLELSGVKIPAGETFTDWLRDLIQLRLNLNELNYQAFTQEGIKRLIACGTTCVGEISSVGVSKAILEKAGLRGIVFNEAIGFQAQRVEHIVLQLTEFLNNKHKNNGLIVTGIAPHAPYSVSPFLFTQISKLAAFYNKRISLHLAESPEEVEFLATGSGAFRKLLDWRGSWDDRWQVPNCSPVEYLQRLQMLNPNLLAVHLNYLQEQDYPLLAQNRVHVVTCPCSNRFLGHKNSHLQALRQQGINIALGTDSLASNEDLNLFNEMRLLLADNPWLGYSDILKMATLNGAKALGLDEQIGTLTIGKQADLIAIAAPAGLASENLAQYVVREAQYADLVMVAGRRISVDHSKT